MSTSDAATPYTVTHTGVQLPDGHVFQAHGHINIKISTPDGTHIRDVNMHFDPNNNHPGGEFIGKDFFPVQLGKSECISWVQVHGFNEHFGEGGQDPVCKPGKPDPKPDPDTEPEPETSERPEDKEKIKTVEGDPDCESLEVATTTTTYVAGHYLGDDGEWHLGGFFPVDTTTTTRPATEEECPTPIPDPDLEDEEEEDQDETPNDNEADDDASESPESPEEGESDLTTTTAVKTSPETHQELAQTGVDAFTPVLLAGAALAALGATLITKKLAKTRS